MSSFQIVVCEEQKQECGSAFITWQEDCKSFRAKIETDVNEKLVEEFAAKLKKQLQDVIGGEIDVFNIESYYDDIFEVLDNSGLYDGCPTQFYVGGKGYDDPYITQSTIASGKADVIRDTVLTILSTSFLGNMVGGNVDVNICVGRCGLGNLTLEFTFFIPPENTIKVIFNYNVEFCECGAQPRVMNGTSTVTITPEVIIPDPNPNPDPVPDPNPPVVPPVVPLTSVPSNSSPISILGFRRN